MKPLLLPLVLLLALSGCSMSLPRMPGFLGGEPPEPTVARVLAGMEDPAPPKTAGMPDSDRVLELYRRAAESETLRNDVGLARRLAELSLDRAAAEGDVADYAAAVADLEHLAGLEIDTNELARVRYRLAHAYEGAGQVDAVQAQLEAAVETGAEGPLALESRFRLAESAFVAGSYAEAAEHYAVVAAAPGSYQTHAAYMLGWASFKRGASDAALLPLAQALDDLYGTAEPDVGQQELLTDALRVMLIALEYEGGIEALDTLMTGLGDPAWNAELYSTMSARYAEAERFADSVAALDAFIARAPRDLRSPEFHLQTLDIWRSGGFAEELRERKESFIERFDVRSEFFAAHGREGLSRYAGRLREYLDARCARRHAAAQSASGEHEFRGAADCHARWLENFPDAPDAPAVRFLLAEALLAAGEPEAAVREFDRVAGTEDDRAREAAFTVVTLQQLLASPEEPRYADRLAAAERFTARFGDDDRAPSVQLDAARLTFDAGDYEAAQVLADEALARWELGADSVIALRIRAHSGFELGDYAAAERDYRQLLGAPEDGAMPRAEVVRRALASILRQGEAARAAGDHLGAVAHFDRLAEVDPRAALTIDARFDTAALFEAAGQPDRAVDRLQRFRSLNPAHAAVADIGPRLVALFEAMGREVDAADELMSMHAASADVEVKRITLFRAAELYYAGGRLPRAIETFRSYAHTFEMPVDLRLEAMHHMDLLYRQTEEPAKQRFWLRKIMATVDAQGAPTARASGLAGAAAMVLAEDALRDFRSIDIAPPLNRTVPRKRKAMSRLIDAMQKVASYNAPDLTSLPTLHIASAYSALADGLLNAAAPTGLSELELEQYEILVEEQAFPFEEQAIDIHVINIERAWSDAWDEHTLASLGELARLSPGRYAREETGEPYVELDL